MHPTARCLCLAAALFFTAVAARADEGLWTFDNFPADLMRKSYGFAPDAAMLDHIRAASVRLPGCSGAIVSGHGLVQTNHHCVGECIRDLSAPGQDLNMTPVLARTPSDERQCPGLSAEIVIAIGDVTAEVTQAMAGLSGAAASAARDAAIARIETACGNVENRYCEVVQLYSGQRFALHTYRVYQDVRLVFAPETAAGSFGGDPDNFEFPRFDFDVAYLRLYENGKPADTPDWLKWRSSPLRDGEPLLISGNPGETGRHWTMSSIELMERIYYPWQLATVGELRGRLGEYARRGTEEARIVSSRLSDAENALKSLWGEHSALVSPGFMQALRDAQARLQAAVAADPALSASVGDAWGEAAAADAEQEALYIRSRYLDAEAGGESVLFGYARNLLRAASERGKPDAERLDGFTDADLEWMRKDLLNPRPVEPALEEMELKFWLSKTRAFLGVNDPVVMKILGKESPEGMASRLVAQTKLGDPQERQRLFDGGEAAVAASTDPMILLAKSFDAEARAIAKRVEASRDRKAAAVARIEAARFKLYGTSEYPDATGTLRINFGKVAGWVEPDGRMVGPFTTLGGLYDRATGADPYRLAPSWVAARESLSPGTIFNVATDNDTIGGNSGSPVIDRDGKLVGALFDGNRPGLGGFFLFDAARNRSVIVASTAIEEALSKVYHLDRIVQELKAE